jgi:uncharacterized protein (DUF736 family)
VSTPAPRDADYQVMLDGREVGAAWEKTARENRKAYLSAQPDPVFLAASINCALTAQEDDSSLVEGRSPGWRPVPFKQSNAQGLMPLQAKTFTV